MDSDFRRLILYTAVECGMSWDDATLELDAFMSGNLTTYTARIRRVMETLDA